MAEAQDRYNRSIAILKERNIPFLESLPLIETTDEVSVRSQDEIILRTRCLVAMARAAFADNLDVAKAVIERWRLEGALTPRERLALEGQSLSKRDRIDFTWAVEAVVPLIWAAGLHDDLYFPDQTADAGSLIDFVSSVTPSMIALCEIRSVAVILDEADLIYRLHWATRQAGIDGKPTPAGMDAGVVQERHHALNWLIGYDDNAAWDEVTTDT